MLAGPQLRSSVSQHQPTASDWAEHFGVKLLNYESVKCRMLWAGAKTNWPEAAIKAVSPREKGLEWPVTQRGHAEQRHYLKSHLEN